MLKKAYEVQIMIRIWCLHMFNKTMLCMLPEHALTLAPSTGESFNHFVWPDIFSHKYSYKFASDSNAILTIPSQQRTNHILFPYGHYTGKQNGACSCLLSNPHCIWIPKTLLPSRIRLLCENSDVLNEALPVSLLIFMLKLSVVKNEGNIDKALERSVEHLEGVKTGDFSFIGAFLLLKVLAWVHCWCWFRTFYTSSRMEFSIVIV